MKIKRLVFEFEASGLRQNGFCRNHGLALGILRRQLKKRRMDKGEAKGGGRVVQTFHRQRCLTHHGSLSCDLQLSNIP